nr:hypothetical protein [[Ruminococcus] lactaris]
MAKKTLIVDIGSWTIDIMPVINKSPDESKCVTIPKGLITCMRSINEQCVRQLKLFIPVQGCLLEVVREQYTDF